MTRVSIVVPAFNVANYITECLQSVIKQSVEWECIVINDGSRDTTEEVARSINDHRIKIVNQPNSGVSVARNTGLSLANGEYVMFLDGDDYLHPLALQRLVKVAEENPDVVATFGTFIKVLDDGTPCSNQKPLARHSYPSGDVLENLLRGNFLANGGHVLIRTAAARAIGGFCGRLRLSEDWEFWCRLAATGQFFFIGNEPEVFALRIRPGSASGGLSADWKHHEPFIREIENNAAIKSRFSKKQWKSITRSLRASSMWECGRVNFTLRKFNASWPMLLRSLALEAPPKRLALFAIVVGQRITGYQPISRFQYRKIETGNNVSQV